MCRDLNTHSRGAERFRRCGDELLEEGADAPVDLVADGPHPVEELARRVAEIPVEVALAGVDRAGVIVSMVMTASASRTASSVSPLGTAVERSMPASRIAATSAGLTSLAGVLPAERTGARPAA
jgi:hypothetical protein